MFYLTKNCWFCNKNSRVWLFDRNAWTCNKCDQYNGFNKNGDYNKEITEMHRITPNRVSFAYTVKGNPFLLKKNNFEKVKSRSNCLCEGCNYNQQKKLEKLSTFQAQSEETFDLEISQYKEYLEKIYELCEKCKSRVKFEITRQDGMLKQYLFQIGEVGFLYEQSRAKKNAEYVDRPHVAALTTRKRLLNGSMRLLASYRDMTRLLAYVLVFFLTSFTLLYNQGATDRSEMSLGKFNLFLESFYEPASELFKSRIEQFILINTNFLKLPAPNDSDVIKDSSFSYFNTKILYNLFFLYFLCSFLVVSSPLENNSKFFKFDISIWLASIALMASNYTLCSRFLEPQTAFDLISSPISLNFVSVLVPFIHLVLIGRLITYICQLFARNRNIMTNVEQPIPLRLKKSFAMNSSDRSISYDVIKPAKFMPTRTGSSTSLFPFKTLKNGSASDLARNEESDCDSDDSSSIVSGLTNLYLNKNTKSNKCSARRDFGLESRSAHRSDMFSSYYNPSMLMSDVRVSSSVKLSRIESRDRDEKKSFYLLLSLIMGSNFAMLILIIYKLYIK